MVLSERSKKIIWNDTKNDIYSNESIARRILAVANDGEMIVEKLTGFTAEEQEELHSRNLKAISNVRKKIFEAKQFLDNEDWPDMFFSCNPYQAFSEIFDINSEQLELLAQDEEKIRRSLTR